MRLLVRFLLALCTIFVLTAAADIALRWSPRGTEAMASNGGCSTLIISSNMDSYVQRSCRNETCGTTCVTNENFGNCGQLEAARTTYGQENNLSIPYLKFDLSDVVLNTTNVTAVLNLWASWVDTKFPIGYFYAAYVDDDSWDEMNITYDNAPQPTTGVISSVRVDKDMTWYSWNVTGLVLDAMNSDRCLSIGILCAGAGGQKVLFSSSEGGGTPHIALVSCFPVAEWTPLWTGLLLCTWGLARKQKVSKRWAKSHPAKGCVGQAKTIRPQRNKETCRNPACRLRA